MLRSLGLAASLAALAADAILIPSTVSIEGIQDGDAGTTSLVDPYRQLLMVPCPGCMYAQPPDEGEGFVWTQGVENALFLNISVGSDPSTLQLNGVQFFPPAITFSMEAVPTPAIAQVPASVSLVDIKENPSRYTTRPLRLTSWSFASASSQTTETGDEILNIMLSINALEQQPVNVPDIVLTALKDTEGKLVILRVDASMRDGAPTDGPQKECKDWPLLCKWRNIISDRLEALKAKMSGHHGCGRKKMPEGHDAPSMLEGVKDSDGNPVRPPTGHENHPHGRPGHHRRPGHHGGHRWGNHTHHKHHKLHRILRAMGRVMLTVFVPILIGVVAGMVLYMLGYLIGVTLAFVLTRVMGFRRGHGYQAVALEEGEEPYDEETPRSSIEKEVYIVEDVVEAPPQYVEVEANEAERK